MALLRLVNFEDHPTEPAWMVFRFADPGMAREFIQGLDEERIGYQTGEEGGTMLIGVKQLDRERAIRVNYAVLGRHRRPFIGDPLLRWLVLGLVGLLVLLALLGTLLG